MVVKGKACRVYWGSHGCKFKRGHTQLCECDCCECPSDLHDGIHLTYVDEDTLCVAKTPYYGSNTVFYGEDAKDRGLPLLESKLHKRKNRYNG